MENYIAWGAVGWETVLDHYRVIGTSGGQERLLGKTIFPFFRHVDLDAAGETWDYAVEVVDAAGNVSARSAVVRSTSLLSVTSGTPLATLGRFDRKSHEFKFAPKGYAQIPEAYPDQKIVVGPQGGSQDVAYLLPGPSDKWAGSKSYTLEWTADIESLDDAAVTALALWLVDTTKLGGTLEIRINGVADSLELPRGATAGSKRGDASGEHHGLKPAALEIDLPAGALRTGENVVTLTLGKGGWLAWDALGLFAREDPAKP